MYGYYRVSRRDDNNKDQTTYIFLTIRICIRNSFRCFWPGIDNVLVELCLIPYPNCAYLQIKRPMFFYFRLRRFYGPKINICPMTCQMKSLNESSIIQKCEIFTQTVPLIQPNWKSCPFIA